MIQTLSSTLHPLNKRIGYFSAVLFHKNHQYPLCPLLKGMRKEKVTPSEKRDPNGNPGRERVCARTLLFSIFRSLVNCG